KEYDNLLLFYREASISLRRKGDGKQNITLQYGNSKNQDDGEETVLTLRLDSSGRLMELNNSSAIIPSKSIQREVLYKALKDSADQRIAMEWMQEIGRASCRERVKKRVGEEAVTKKRDD